MTPGRDENDQDPPSPGNALDRDVYSGRWWARVIGLSLLFGAGSAFVVPTSGMSTLATTIIGVSMSLVALVFFVVKKGKAKIW